MTIPDERERRRHQRRRARSGRSSMHVSKLTRALIRALVERTDAACADEALYFMAREQLALVGVVLEPPTRPALPRSPAPSPPRWAGA